MLETARIRRNIRNRRINPNTLPTNTFGERFRHLFPHMQFPIRIDTPNARLTNRDLFQLAGGWGFHTDPFLALDFVFCDAETPISAAVSRSCPDAIVGAATDAG